MALDLVTLALAKSYVNKTVAGAGALQGLPGPPGKDGKDGEPGPPGKDGIDATSDIEVITNSEIDALWDAVFD